MSTIALRVLGPDDTGLAGDLARLINDVYAVAEEGLWRAGTARTTPAEVAGLIGAGEIVLATRDGAVAGSMRLHDVAEDTSEFGMLVAAPELRGTGVGRALVTFAEERSRERGVPTMQLELLLPRGWRHPSKERLRAWYGRMGYRPVRSAPFTDSHPHLEPLLATPCDLAVHQKPLRASG